MAHCHKLIGPEFVRKARRFGASFAHSTATNSLTVALLRSLALSHRDRRSLSPAQLVGIHEFWPGLTELRVRIRSHHLRISPRTQFEFMRKALKLNTVTSFMCSRPRKRQSPWSGSKLIPVACSLSCLSPENWCQSRNLSTVAPMVILKHLA